MNRSEEVRLQQVLSEIQSGSVPIGEGPYYQEPSAAAAPYPGEIVTKVVEATIDASKTNSGTN